METIRLIVNADDLGLSKEVNEGIHESTREGCVQSVSLLTHAPASQDALRIDWKGASLGIHLNLTEPWDHLERQAPGGFFRGHPGPLLKDCLLRRVDLDYAESALRRQIEAFLAAGRTPSHMDGHHHVHLFPRISAVAARLAEEYGIPGTRLALMHRSHEKGALVKRLFLHLLSRKAAPHFQSQEILFPSRFLGFSLYNRPDFLPRLHGVLNRLEPDTYLLMVHPGCSAAETGALTDPSTLELIHCLKIELVPFDVSRISS